jgi:hypothetical protein
MDGLAHSVAGPAAQQQQGQSPQGMPTVEEVAALLMQGVDPQQLLESGIPEQLIMQAIALVEQQMAAEQQGAAQGGGGLAQAIA